MKQMYSKEELIKLIEENSPQIYIHSIQIEFQSEDYDPGVDYEASINFLSYKKEITNKVKAIISSQMFNDNGEYILTNVNAIEFADELENFALDIDINHNDAYENVIASNFSRATYKISTLDGITIFTKTITS